MARKLSFSGYKGDRGVREEHVCNRVVRRGVENKGLVHRRVIANRSIFSGMLRSLKRNHV
jgi:hypothetical protein